MGGERETEIENVWVFGSFVLRIFGDTNIRLVRTYAMMNIKNDESSNIILFSLFDLTARVKLVDTFAILDFVSFLDSIFSFISSKLFFYLSNFSNILFRSQI